MRLLVLGGTTFLGPALVEAARARGHELTLFHRGKASPGGPEGVRTLLGDRDPEKGAGLRALASSTWDAAIDTSGFFPRTVRASAELLAPRVSRYVFVSTVSVYATCDEPGADETAPLATVRDPEVEDLSRGRYGALKALCERAVEAALPSRATIVRPGFIVGPRDPSDRFTYWVARFARGGEVLVPGDLSDPVQLVDVRDLAAWLVRLAETGTTGVFNAVGPERPLRFGDVVRCCAARGGVTVRTVPWERLEGVSFPICLPPSGETRGFHGRANARAVAAGLRFRRLEETVDDTRAWFQGLPEARPGALRAGPSPERERDLLGN